MAEPYSEDRDETRFDHNSPLQVKDLGSGAIYEARMQNYSNGGIYFESDGLLQKGTKIYICMQNSPYAQSSGVLEYYTGEVMWRKILKRSFFNYGYGIQLVFVSGKEDLKTNDPKAKDLRKNSRKLYFQNILYRTQKGLHTGKTKNISASGAFIATEEKLKVGQQLKLSLPVKNGKTAEILGQIVWLNEEGFGLKFQKVK
jgi:Tfp pilus assembly protein PilZ